MIAAACVIAAAASACGKKGAPLPPIVRVPEAVKQITARRVGGDVVLTLVMPAQNVDGSTPVALGRVDVYGYTSRSAPPLARFTEVAALVGTLAGGEKAAGASAVLRDTLTADELAAGPLPARGAGPGPPTAGATVEAGTSAAQKRFYVAIPLSDRGRAGPPSAVVEVPLTPLPDAPLDVRASYTAEAAVLTWEPSGGLIGFLLDRAAPPAASPLDDGPPVTEAGTLPPGPTQYNVYREDPPDPSATAAVESAPAALPSPPLNQMPIDGLGFTDPLELDGRRRCYAVAAVRGTGDRTVEGDRSSRPACINPVDTFPPAPPVGVSPIAAEGEIGLVWEANTEPDVRGYIVVRGEAGDDVLTPVTDEVVSETRFTDRGVRPGVRYVYAVKAVDRRLPKPNVSDESERVEITAR